MSDFFSSSDFTSSTYTNKTSQHYQSPPPNPTDLALIIITAMIPIVLVVWFLLKVRKIRNSSSQNQSNELDQPRQFRSLPSSLKIVILPGNTIAYATREEQDRSNESRTPSLYEVSVGNSTRIDRISTLSSQNEEFGSRSCHGGLQFFRVRSGSFERQQIDRAQKDSKSWHGGQNYKQSCQQDKDDNQ
eukprot:TRINITY_DN44944_c0_g1_i1.p2 TRINITY_DN44944_c0_g1~~TRINITY_DN44944_c0_g1_i1.p2  ORF type:complete len:211 (+),score=3.77 TRINITY_DN44944_c0_g1_i1:70-633(+)